MDLFRLFVGEGLFINYVKLLGGGGLVKALRYKAAPGALVVPRTVVGNHCAKDMKALRREGGREGGVGKSQNYVS